MSKTNGFKKWPHPEVPDGGQGSSPARPCLHQAAGSKLPAGGVPAPPQGGAGSPAARLRREWERGAGVCPRALPQATVVRLPG